MSVGGGIITIIAILGIIILLIFASMEISNLSKLNNKDVCIKDCSKLGMEFYHYTSEKIGEMGNCICMSDKQVTIW